MARRFPTIASAGALLRLAQADIDEDARALIAAGNLERLLAWDKGAGKVDNRSHRLHKSHRIYSAGAAAAEVSSKIAAEYMAEGRSAHCPIVDMHGHWGPFGGSLSAVCAGEEHAAGIRRAGVKHIVCSAHDALFADPEQGNLAMQEAVARNPGILSAYWAVNPNYPNLAVHAPEDFQKSRGFVGFKFLPDYHAYPLTGGRYRPALEYADENGLLVLVHTWGGSAFNSPQMLGEIAAQYPRATFLMGHSGYGDWAAAVRAARELANVYLELTAVYVAHDFAMQPSGSGTPAALISCLQVNGILEYMVEQAGSQKIVFGTDMPWYSPHYAAGAVLFAKISDDARHDILHRNAERLLGRTSEKHDTSERFAAGALGQPMARVDACHAQRDGVDLAGVHDTGIIHHKSGDGAKQKVDG